MIQETLKTLKIKTKKITSIHIRHKLLKLKVKRKS